MPDAKAPGEVELAYDLQKFEDTKAGDFELRADQAFMRFAFSAGPFIQNYVTARRVSGTWAGVPQCSPTEMVLADSLRPVAARTDRCGAHSAAGRSALDSGRPNNRAACHPGH